MSNSVADAPVLSQRRPLRALIEIIGGELHVYPVASTDDDEKLIWDALRFVREDLER